MRRLFALALPVAFLLTGCATSMTGAGPAAPTDPARCEELAWDDCGRTAGCRHGRSFDSAGTETFQCVARYTDLVSVLATPGVQPSGVSLRIGSGGGASIAQP